MDYTSTTGSPTFPEDLERVICEILLDDARDMRGAMSLVASRFNVCSWVICRTKPIKFHTVVIRGHDNWTQRLDDCILPNAGLIRALVLNLPRSEKSARCRFSDEELSSLRRLLSASEGVRHLAVTWNIWAYLEPECGALGLQSLCLIWDDLLIVRPPQLAELQHPAALEDITMFAPLSLRPRWRTWARLEDYYLPDTRHCTNLAYVTYATASIGPWTGDQRLKGYMAVAVGERTLYAVQREGTYLTVRRKEGHPNYATLCVRTWDEVLREWLNKVEGRESLLEHSPPRI
ncbi:hypothetical protein C8R46DRAFT_1189256 [Mycena filopes]|nr:hypothetical protein C8R46DRAFT_1189256 [Mycena filopes]